MNISWWKWLCFLLMLYVIYGAFFVAKGAVNFVGGGDIARIVFFHVPVATLSSFCSFAGAIYAALFLWKGKNMETDAKSLIAMELGFIASILATITGSIFAAAQWNSYWNWDPREISIVGVLLIYGAYLVLRGAVNANPIRRAQLSSVYAIITLIPTTFLIWVVPRLPALQSLHPTTVLTDADATSPSYKIVLCSSFLAFSLLFMWLFQLRYRVQQLSTRNSMRIE